MTRNRPVPLFLIAIWLCVISFCFGRLFQIAIDAQSDFESTRSEINTPNQSPAALSSPAAGNFSKEF